MLKEFFKNCFTENDGVSFCPVRACFIIGFCAILGFTLHDLATGKEFMSHANEWISGIANYLGFGGAAVAGKSFTEKE